ncbi:MAG: hypothetical protein ABSG67_17170 [Thermoguttaceae bacterium]|jgi:hypothetical protein
MAAMIEKYERKRVILAQVRDEFRRLSIQYPPLYHERFYSPLNVSEAGWKEFVAAAEEVSGPFPSTRRQPWEHWYVEPKGRWAGRFYGAEDGFMEFQSLCKSLSHILSPVVTLWPEVTEWIRVLHEMAEDCPSPLLWAPRRIWKFPPETILAAGGIVGHPLREWAPVRPPCAPYPKHPLRRALAFNLFSSSVAAIEIILAPEKSLFIGDIQPEDLPVVLPREELPSAEESQVKIEPDEQKLVLSDDKDFFPFLFRKAGDRWIVRFWTGEKMEKAIVGKLKGCSHYQRLLTSPGKSIPAIALDPPKMSDLTDDPSFMSEDEYNREIRFEGDDRRKYHWPDDNDDLNRIREHRELVLRQIRDESDDARHTELKEILKEMDNNIREYFHGIEDEARTTQAFRRVKRVMWNARDAMKNGESLPGFLEHLRRSFQEVGQGFLYDPRPPVNWET